MITPLLPLANFRYSLFLLFNWYLHLKKTIALKLPPLWRKRWQTIDPFWHIFHLQGKLYREQPGRKTLRFIEDNEPYFVKCHFGVGWKEIFKNLFQGRLPVLGAKNEYLAIERLSQFGFVPKIIGYGCRGKNPATQESFLITKELSYTISLEDFCRDWPKNPPSLKLKRALIRRVALITKTLHAQGINHRDLYLCHFLLDITGETEFLNPYNLNIYLIDLHRAQIRLKVPLRWKIKDLAGLYFSAMDIGLTKSDLMRFIKVYDDKKPSRFWHKVSRRAISLYRRILRKLSTTPSAPFYLTLKKNNYLYGHTLLRVLPRKRMTLLGTWNNHSIVAKLMVKKHHIMLEKKGYEALVQNGFATPKCHYETWSQHHALYCFFYDYRKNARSLAQVFKESDLEKKQALLSQLIQLISQQHDKGIKQLDGHLDNYLFENNQLFTIDVGTIRQQSLPLNQTQRENNLAFLFAQFSSDEPQLWQKYATPTLMKKTKEIREKFLKKYLEKAQRNCTAYRKIQYQNYHLILNRRYDNEEFRTSLKNLLEKNDFNENLQAFNNRSLKDYFFSPARKQWLSHHQEMFNKKLDRTPIALIEKKKFGLTLWSAILFG